LIDGDKGYLDILMCVEWWVGLTRIEKLRSSEFSYDGYDIVLLYSDDMVE
jgi:hypothetical protein